MVLNPGRLNAVPFENDHALCAGPGAENHFFPGDGEGFRTSCTVTSG